MTTIAARRAMRAGETSQAFYVWISLAMAAVFVGGFSQTVPGDFIDTPPLPMLLHVHGAIFTLWVFLFVAQPALIARGSVRLHRRVGWIGLGLAVAMVAMGVAATLFAIRNRLIPPFFPPTVFMVMNLIGILTFGGLVTAGLVMRRKRQWHKRLMLCATISILGPGLGRLLPMASFGAAAPLVMFGAILLFGVVAMAADLIARGRIHPAYFWGVGTILVTELAIGPLAFSPPAAELLRFIQSV
ncbi:hypothetical protein NED98_17575 [Sphingomonas sp. MMSM20]|uniref:hypothetical protein n=1 Tax=Sphingomonas TaxID=13687 RepID=UPI00092902DB|nr:MULTISPECIES: hypothetical protein [Sphingomonas]MCW6532061.1 hypothetical protein [Sphingomonas lycopersici]OJU15326.1 MAG: hypothetical protein BGN95_12590 [Sphingomonas sp. 66-10]